MSQTSVREIPTTDGKGLKSFAALERRWVGSNPQYVSEIDAAFFSEMEHVLFTAANGDRDVARCAALINRRYREATSSEGLSAGSARGPGKMRQYVPCSERAEAWLKNHGVDHIVAPFNGAAILGVGVRSAGYDEDPTFPSSGSAPYSNEYLAGLGDKASYPLWYYTVDFASQEYQATKRRASEAKGVVVRPVDKKRWDRELETFLVVFNDTFKDEWEFPPLTLDECHEFLDPMKPLLDRHHRLIGEVNGQTAGFCLGMPDWTPLFRSFKGKVGSPQVIRLMLTAGRYQRAGLLA